MTAAAFSGDGSVLAVAAESVITLWDPDNNTLVGVIAESLSVSYYSSTCIFPAVLKNCSFDVSHIEFAASYKSYLHWNIDCFYVFVSEFETTNCCMECFKSFYPMVLHPFCRRYIQFQHNLYNLSKQFVPDNASLISSYDAFSFFIGSSLML
jgi:hypothetical protein